MKKISLFALTVLMLSSCGSTMEVFSDYDKQVNLAAYKTYSWPDLKSIEGKGMNPLYYNELNDKRIKDAVNIEMLARNYSLGNEKAALEIHYHIIVEDKIGSTVETAGSQYHPLSNLTKVNSYQYRQGTLIIDVMDTKTNTLIWRGWGTDVVTNAIRKNPEAAIQNAVMKIFKAFPVKGS
ncbi:DUF4136 domain-containing protein [soil metagenome]